VARPLKALSDTGSYRLQIVVPARLAKKLDQRRKRLTVGGEPVTRSGLARAIILAAAKDWK